MIENSDFNKDAFGNTNFDKKKKGSQTTNTDFEAYLEWMKKMKFIFDCHHYFE